MWYANVEKGEVLTETFAYMIQGVFAHVRNKEPYKFPNSRNIYLMNPYTWEVLDSDFADKIIPSRYKNSIWSPLTNSLLVDNRLSEDITSNLLIRFKKDNLIWLCDQSWNIIVKPFAEYIFADGIYKTYNESWVINMLTWEIEMNYDEFDNWTLDIYQPDLNAGQTNYIVKVNKNLYILDNFYKDQNYLKTMLELLKYQE